MKKLSVFINEAAKELDVQSNPMNYISSAKLKSYLDIASKFISQEAKEVINWLIANNGTYMKEIGTLQKFYNNGKPKDQSLVDLYKWIGVLSKKNRLLEVPVFQTEEQFNGIISKEISPDEILLDLKSASGRDAVAKKYTPLVWKIARGFNGKSNFTLDDLFAFGLEGLTIAMNQYGKSHNEISKKKSNGGEEAEDMAGSLKAEMEKRKAFTFLSYASYLIRIVILENIKNSSHLVRIPVSVQNRERKETGCNTKQMSVSGESPIGGDEEGRGIFDKIDSREDADGSVDQQDISKLWKMIIKKLEAKFDKKQLDIFYSMNGLFGHEKLKGKEIMAKYGMKNPSEISNSNYKVLQYIKTTKALRDAFAELYSLYKECLNDEDRRNDDTRIYSMNEGVSNKNYSMFE